VIEALSRDELSGVAVDPIDREHVALAADLVARFTTAGRPLNFEGESVSLLDQRADGDVF